MSLEKHRKKIDKIDDEIIELINSRVRIAVEIGKIKDRESREYHAPDRERGILERLESRNKGPLPSESVRAIYREIMSASLALQHRVCIAYLGPEATFTHLAALKKFGASAHYLSAKSIADVFADVEKGRAEYGVVPIENSMEGGITHTLDMFIDSELKIWAEVSLAISHNLLSNVPLEGIRVVYSHPQAFAQCRLWVEGNLSSVVLKEVSSTAKAAELASSEKGTAAIASEVASRLYNLKTVAKGIEDSGPNLTRFLVISKGSPERTGVDKTSVMFSIKDRVGALYDMLQPFKKCGINLTKIESRPSRRKAWDYFFFVDIMGHQKDENVARALNGLAEECVYLKILGSYPVAKLEDGKTEWTLRNS